MTYYKTCSFSVLTFMVTVVSVPYNSCIVAHEYMRAFAYIGIVDACLKLVAVFLLLVFPYDKLIFYAFGVFVASVIVRVLYSFYCKRHFEECTYRFIVDWKLLKKMFSFAGWRFWGNLGFSFKDQGSNIVLNLFYGYQTTHLHSYTSCSIDGSTIEQIENNIRSLILE